jgi:hypothetical protein
MMSQRKKFVCATCKSNFDLFGLFSHMKQVPVNISLRKMIDCSLLPFSNLRLLEMAG